MMSVLLIHNPIQSPMAFVWTACLSWILMYRVVFPNPVLNIYLLYVKALQYIFFSTSTNKIKVFELVKSNISCSYINIQEVHYAHTQVQIISPLPNPPVCLSKSDGLCFNHLYFYHISHPSQSERGSDNEFIFVAQEILMICSCLGIRSV